MSYLLLVDGLSAGSARWYLPSCSARFIFRLIALSVLQSSAKDGPERRLNIDGIRIMSKYVYCVRL